MQKTTDHSYEGIQQALQIAVDSNNDLQLASEQSGIPKRTLYRYFERMQKGQAIRGVHSRRGTSAVFYLDENNIVQMFVSDKHLKNNKSPQQAIEERIAELEKELAEAKELLVRAERKIGIIEGSLSRIKGLASYGA
ncbi:hypothetical protein NMW79_00915 [Pasteurella multocida]|nr:hypothetical protein [Pasteurella multocida]